MIALSIKNNNFSYLSFYNENNQIIINDYGFMSLKNKIFSKDSINQIQQRKQVKKSNVISKKCMIFLDTDNVILNQLKNIDEISFKESIYWQNQLIFGHKKSPYFNGYHYKAPSDNNILSIYIDENKQIKYLKDCSNAGMNLKVLSLGIFSAEYLARELFNGKDQNSYIVWSVGDDFDEIIIVEQGLFKSLGKFKRNSKSVSPISYLGSKKHYDNCIKELNSINLFKDLKSINIVDKIYMYQRTQNTDMKKILKKNKEAVIILNPLLKSNFIKKTKINDIDSSYLSEMGYIFKSITND